jgi:hypothetical protein
MARLNFGFPRLRFIFYGVFSLQTFSGALFVPVVLSEPLDFWASFLPERFTLSRF